MNKIVLKVRSALKSYADEKTKTAYNRFFKESVKCHGVKSASIGKVSKELFEDLRNLSKKEMFVLCEELLRTDYSEEAFVALNWVYFIRDSFIKEDFAIFEKWIQKYINNWAKCDVFCTGSIGHLVEKYPELISKLRKWTKSKNRWVKRASAVTLIGSARKGKYLKDAFEISESLIKDQDDMVQKGYGWLLKEESRVNQKEVFDYVIKNKAIMPRTALRYAIELMPKALRIKAMARNFETS